MTPDASYELAGPDPVCGCPLTQLVAKWHDLGLAPRDTYGMDLERSNTTGLFEWTSENGGLRHLSPACEPVE